MLNKQMLLKDLKELRDIDKKLANEAKTAQEKNFRTGSLITLESIIEFIEEGAYEKK